MVFVGVVALSVLAAIAVARTRRVLAPALERAPAAAASAPPARATQDDAQASAPEAQPARRARPTTTPPRTEEAQQLDAIRATLRADPQKALALLDLGDRDYPSGALVEQRAALRVDALVFAQRIGLARDAAEEYLRRFPDGGAAQHIEMLTGVHPRPPIPNEAR